MHTRTHAHIHACTHAHTHTHTHIHSWFGEREYCYNSIVAAFTDLVLAIPSPSMICLQTLLTQNCNGYFKHVFCNAALVRQQSSPCMGVWIPALIYFNKSDFFGSTQKLKTVAIAVILYALYGHL